MNMKSKILSILNGILTLVVNLCRFTLSAVFLASGFVKAIDPTGMGYKINAYLHNWAICSARDSACWRDISVFRFLSKAFFFTASFAHSSLLQR